MDSKIKTCYIFRPGFINPRRKKAVTGILLKLSQWAYKMYPGLGVNVDDLAKVMVDVGLHGHPKNILSNADLRNVAEWK